MDLKLFNRSQREKIYATPQMYIGKYWGGSDKWDNEAIRVLIMLVIRQAVDAETFNQCSVLKVTLDPDDVIIIQDNGIGIPIVIPSYLENSDVTGLTRLLDWYMPTGVDRPKKFYEEYGFLDYLARLLNVLSESLRIDTVWRGQSYTVSCACGETMIPLQKVDEGTLKKGTRIRFKPDSDVFPNPVFSEEALKKMLDDLAIKFPKVKFEFIANNI